MVSVITPVYNRELYIEECVQSVLKQSYQDFEVILVDDGSTDKTLEICRKLASEDKRIRLLSGKHQGVSAARNIAVNAAAGEYIFFLDSDDVIHPMLLETLIHAARSHNAAIAATDVARSGKSNWHRVSEAMQKSCTLGEFDFKNEAETLRGLMFGGTAISCIGGVMFRRDLIGDTRFRTDLHIGEDYYFIYQNIIKGASAAFLKPKWYYVRVHDQNISWDYAYSGFWTRFYRRKLVWEQEEAFGRAEHATIQKRDAFSCFTTCVRKNKPYSKDSIAMRRVVQAHKKAIFPALTRNGKIAYFLYVYLPAFTHLLYKVKDKKK